MASPSLYIADVLTTDWQVDYVRASYVAPWECQISYHGRHDADAGVELWDAVRVEDGGVVRFRGNLTQLTPGGVAEEGITALAHGKRWRLRQAPVRINGRGFYVWNRRGHECAEGDAGEDSPGQDGGKWTAGEVIVDILEHALGVPAAGSDIAGHHSRDCCCIATYLTAADIAGYTAADWLDRDSVLGEFSVDGTSVEDAISLLLALNGGFYGWYIDPVTQTLELVDLDTLATTDLAAGQLGHWQDEGGTDYRLLDNTLAWSLDGVCSTIIIQGQDRTVEEQPANIEGSGNAGAGKLGELERVASPWRGYAAAYRHVCQPRRHPTARPIDEANAHTPPAGYVSYGHLPRVYWGTNYGSKAVYDPPGGIHPTYLLQSGMVVFEEDPETNVPAGHKLWGWYWARMPFTVTAGPDGDAYACYGYEATRVLYDPAFRHTSTYPRPGTADDETAMQTLADRLLRLYRDVRRDGTLLVDEVDWALDLDARYNVTNLTASGSACDEDPTEWSELAINAVEVTWDLTADRTELRVANTFWMLEEYSELKRRLKLNLFARRELALSEDIYACQITEPAVVDLTTEAPKASTTLRPTTAVPPTTQGPPTTAEPPTTETPTTETPTTETPTTAEPTTAAPTTSTEAATTSSTAAPTTTEPTTTVAPTTGCPVGCGDCESSYSTVACGGTITWDWASGEEDSCLWVFTGATGLCIALVLDGVHALRCSDGRWEFQIRHVIDGWTATYHKAAYDDCPDGTYTKVSGNAAAPATLTLS